MYYWSLCEVFYRFRAENELSPAELCAFLYDFAPNFMPQKEADVPQPTQAWCIGGLIDKMNYLELLLASESRNKERRYSHSLRNRSN